MTASTVAPLQELEADLPEGMEFVDGKLVEKTGMTLKHGSAQANLVAEWRIWGF